MTYWELISYIDIALFIIVSATILYLAVFAIASLFYRHNEIPKARTRNRFIILIPVHKNGTGAEHTVLSALGQSYPQRLFDITVISDHLDEISNFRIAQQPVTLLTPNFKKGSRAKSLQLAINNLPQFKIYDIVVILNGGNIVEPDFLERMNDAYESAGTKAIQAHRLSQNRDTASARLSAIFEEINNSIFRRGHIMLGLSAASAGTAMAFDFNWFRDNIKTVTTAFDDKELEIRLLRQHIYIDYFDDIMVFEEKARNAEDFNRQRRRWLLSQFTTIFRNILYLPGAIFTKHYNLMDKIIQWMLLPRLALIAVILFMSVVMPFIYFSLALKWWALFGFVFFVFALATPNYLVDEKWDKTFYMAPLIFLSSILSKTILGKRLKAYTNQKL
ncbi:MAG: glycosyltransferase family 2 protein [Prevotella sp.]|nr:glycosyltransferase family 2 protein [Prevotella sp.]